MKREVKELKRIARNNLQGNFLGLIRAFVFCDLIVSLIETPFSMFTTETLISKQNIIYIIALAIIAIASVVLTVGQYCLHLCVARTGKIYLSHFIYPIKYDANRLIGAEVILLFLRGIGIAPSIGALAILGSYADIQMYLVAFGLCILACILTALVEIHFGMLYFVLIDNEEMRLWEAYKTTLKFIQGHRGRFFYMQLSFGGMYFLSLLTLGIGLLWVQPYVMQTTTLFYLDAKGELDEILENRRKKEPTPSPVIFDQYV